MVQYKHNIGDSVIIIFPNQLRIHDEWRRIADIVCVVTDRKTDTRFGTPSNPRGDEYALYQMSVTSDADIRWIAEEWLISATEENRINRFPLVRWLNS